MSPRDFTPSVVQSRSRQMRELLDDLATLGPVTAEQLHEDGSWPAPGGHRAAEELR